MANEPLSAPYVLEYTYRRYTGPSIGNFLTGLRDKKILGAKTSDGRVICPPAEYDPVTSEELGDFVELGQSGVVTTWSWVAEPREKHLLNRPFAFALVKIEGADTAMLHMVDCGGDKSAMKTGMRVKAHWAEERVGHISDLAYFEPEA